MSHTSTSQTNARRLIASLSLLLSICVGDPATLSAEFPICVTTVTDNGMPKNIVPKGAAWNFGPGSLWTHRGWQYAAYWDDACQVSVARRKVPSGDWSVVSLPGYRRTENVNRGKGGPVSQGFGDGHEKVSMGISPDGVIHLAFDHHLSTLHYRTSKMPVADAPEEYVWNADLFGPAQDNLGGPMIESVTYPQFYTDGANFLLYLRLGGGSGSANSHLFTYESGCWTVNTEAASKFLDRNWSGGDQTVNAYPQGFVFLNGRLHLTWCWRDTPVASTCHDLCYAYSDDVGKTWLNNEGRVIAERGVSLISADSPGVSVWPIPAGTRYQNGGSMTVDSTGRVHVLVRSENGSPAHFQRDPATAKWTRQRTSQLGILVPGRNDQLFVVSDDGLWCASASHFGVKQQVALGQPSLFEDSKMIVDPTRTAQDGWLSVIGQQGTTVTVIDYLVGGTP